MYQVVKQNRCPYTGTVTRENFHAAFATRCEAATVADLLEQNHRATRRHKTDYCDTYTACPLTLSTVADYSWCQKEEDDD